MLWFMAVLVWFIKRPLFASYAPSRSSAAPMSDKCGCTACRNAAGIFNELLQGDVPDGKGNSQMVQHLKRVRVHQA